MPRTKKNITVFSVGDKVKHISDAKSEGVIVHHYSVAADGREWSIHWYKNVVARGVYKSEDIKKYY